MTRDKQMRNLLNQVLVKEMNHYHFYYEGVRNLEKPTAVRLFENLAESAAGFIDALEMILKTEDLNTEIVENCDLAILDDPPDPTPVDPKRAEKDMALQACNESLKNEYASYIHLLACAGGIEDSEWGDLCKKIACLKSERIDWIRAVAETL